MKVAMISVECKEAVLKKNWQTVVSAAVAVLLVGPSGGALANGLGENISWQFQTTQDKVNKSAVLDQIEKKKGGYYDAANNTYNTTYNIDRQYNCSVSAGTTGNSGSNGQSASTSSPTVTNSGSTSASTAANAASNGLGQNGLSGVLVAGLGDSPSGGVDSAQNNSGALTSGVESSNTSAATGPLSANGGVSDQALNSTQTNAGNLASTISSSTACAGPLNAN